MVPTSSYFQHSSLAPIPKVLKTDSVSYRTCQACLCTSTLMALEDLRHRGCVAHGFRGIKAEKQRHPWHRLQSTQSVFGFLKTRLCMAWLQKNEIVHSYLEGCCMKIQGCGHDDGYNCCRWAAGRSGWDCAVRSICFYTARHGWWMCCRRLWRCSHALSLSTPYRPSTSMMSPARLAVSAR